MGRVDNQAGALRLLARVRSMLPTLVVVVLVAAVVALLAGCSLFSDPTQVNNVFSNISNGLSQ
jgi:hypothetical protein